MIAKCGTVIIGYGGMGGWHTQQLKTMEEINLLGVYDILPAETCWRRKRGFTLTAPLRRCSTIPRLTW